MKDLLVILQARMGASRLPGKMSLSISGETILECVLSRLKSEIDKDNIVVATTSRVHDDGLAEEVLSNGCFVFRGSESDVLSRYIAISKKFNKKYVCRMTGDSPLVDPKLIIECYEQLKNTGADYVSTTLEDRFPVGVHIEIFRAEFLNNVQELACESVSREHVTPFIYNNKDNLCLVSDSDRLYPEGRYTLDFLEDFTFFSAAVRALCKRKLSEVTREDLWRLSKEQPRIFEINKSIVKSRTA